jgi:NADPH2:quinone reductase
MIGHVTDPTVVGGLARRELSEPDVGSHDTLVEVHAYSVNRGELGLLEQRPDGWRPGQDVAGLVIAQAPDGTGPIAGTRVTGHAEGGSWSERVNVVSNRLGVIPDSVSYADAAGLPAAGLTALRALRAGGSLLAKSVLVTGASGGVGHFAIQLAGLAGADVTALVSGPHRLSSLAGYDAEVVTTLDTSGKFDVVLDGVGGPILMDAIHHLAPGGAVIAYGLASGETSDFAFRDFPWGEVNSLTGFYLWSTPEATFGQDLTYLAGLIGKRRLDVRSSVRRDWSATTEAVEMLRSRQATGKVILTIS